MGQYIYRSRRVEGWVVKEYVGRAADPVVQVLVQADELGRAEASAAVAEVRVEQAAYVELEPMLKALIDALKEVHEANFLAYGHRRRKGQLQAVKFRNSKPNHNEGDGSEEPISRELFAHLTQRPTVAIGRPHNGCGRLFKPTPRFGRRWAISRGMSSRP